jgi:hypothetical protein
MCRPVGPTDHKSIFSPVKSVFLERLTIGPGPAVGLAALYCGFVWAISPQGLGIASDMVQLLLG